MNLKKQIKRPSNSENLIDWKIDRGLSSPTAPSQTEKEMLSEFKARISILTNVKQN